MLKKLHFSYGTASLSMVKKKLDFSLAVRRVVANSSWEPPKNFSNLQTHKHYQASHFNFGTFYTLKTGQNRPKYAKKSIFGHILQEHATTIQLVLLSYIFIALSRDTSFVHIFFAYGQIPTRFYGQKSIFGIFWPVLGRFQSVKTPKIEIVP